MSATKSPAVSSTDPREHPEFNPKHEWGTPPNIVLPLAEALGGFDLDPASGAEPRPYADTRYTIEDDGLSQPWFGNVWVNPPFGRSENKEWARKVVEESRRREVDSITVLHFTFPQVNYFQDHYSQADLICIHRQPIRFIKPPYINHDKSNPSYPSWIYTFGIDNTTKEYRDCLRELGTLLRPE